MNEFLQNDRHSTAVLAARIETLEARLTELEDQEESLSVVVPPTNFHPPTTVTDSEILIADRRSNSLQIHTVYGEHSLYGMITPLTASPDWTELGTGANEYLVAVRHNPTGGIPTLRWADFTETISNRDLYVAISSDDTTPDYLQNQLVAASPITVTVTSPVVPGDETMTIGFISGTSHDGEVLFWNGDAWAPTSLNSLLTGRGLFWELGNSTTAKAYGTLIGNSSQTEVINLNERSLKSGPWRVTDATEITFGTAMSGSLYAAGGFSAAKSAQALYLYGNNDVNVTDGVAISGTIYTPGGMSAARTVQGETFMCRGAPTTNYWNDQNFNFDASSIGKVEAGTLTLKADNSLLLEAGSLSIDGNATSTVANWMRKGLFTGPATAMVIQVPDGSGGTKDIEVLARAV